MSASQTLPVLRTITTNYSKQRLLKNTIPFGMQSLSPLFNSLFSVQLAELSYPQKQNQSYIKFLQKSLSIFLYVSSIIFQKTCKILIFSKAKLSNMLQGEQNCIKCCSLFPLKLGSNHRVDSF